MVLRLFRSRCRQGRGREEGSTRPGDETGRDGRGTGRDEKQQQQMKGAASTEVQGAGELRGALSAWESVGWRRWW